MADRLKWGLAAALAAMAEAAQKRCQKDTEARDIPINIYYCDDATPESECCEKDGQYTCCLPQTDNTAREQAMLWGPIAGIILLVFIVCLFFRKESYLCEGDSVKQRCQNCCRPSSKKKYKKKKKKKKKPSKSLDKAKLVDEDGLVEVLAHPYKGPEVHPAPRPGSGMSMVRGLVPQDFDERVRTAQATPLPGSTVDLHRNSLMA